MGINKTEKYLSPVVKSYNKKLKEELSKLAIISWGIGDKLYKELKDCKYNLFILAKTEGISSILDVVRESTYYADDYKFNNYHVIVLKLKKKHHNAFDQFLQSRYSKMFSPREIKTMFEQFKDGRPNDAYYILARDARYESKFMAVLIKEFNLDIEIDVSDREWDFPIKLNEEIFNYD